MEIQTFGDPPPGTAILLSLHDAIGHGPRAERAMFRGRSRRIKKTI